MAKRFTDTGKWDKEWYMGLSTKGKLLWNYLCDKCSHAGVWEKNMRLVSFHLGEPVSETDFALYGLRVIEIDADKIFLPGFVPFQYGHLNPANRMHASVIRELEKYGINPTTLAPSKALISPLDGAKDKEQDKDKDNEQEEGGLGETKPAKPKRARKDYAPEFEAAYKQYPRQEGKSAGYKTWLKEIQTAEDNAELLKAIGNYTEVVRREGRDTKHIKNFATFMNCYRDYVSLVFNTPNSAHSSSEQRVNCNACTRGLIEAIKISSGGREFTACSCPAGRAKTTYTRFDETKFERVGAA